MTDEKIRERFGKSLSPYEMTMPLSKERLDVFPQDSDDSEVLMMNLWEKENTPQVGLNNGLVPLDLITHQCSEDCHGHNHVHSAEIDEHDIRIAAATVQWLATNCGRGFYDEFRRALLVARGRKVAKTQSE